MTDAPCRERAQRFVARWLESGGDTQELVDRVMAIYLELNDAAEEMESMLPYVGDYFVQKWGYDESLARAQRFLTEALEQ